MAEALLPIERLSRREALRHIALGVSLASPLTLAAGQHVHAAAEAAKAAGVYQPKLFTSTEFAALQRLAELIIPADGVSGSAKEAGAAEFIDLLASQNDELAAIFRGGLLWLDSRMRVRQSATFLSAAASQQTALLDELLEASRQQRGWMAGTQPASTPATARTAPPSPLTPGLPFFEWLLRLTVDAFYTSAMGIKDLGFQGNAMRSSYEVPQEAIDYALKRSPLAGA